MCTANDTYVENRARTLVNTYKKVKWAINVQILENKQVVRST